MGGFFNTLFNGGSQQSAQATQYAGQEAGQLNAIGPTGLSDVQGSSGFFTKLMNDPMGTLSSVFNASENQFQTGAMRDINSMTRNGWSPNQSGQREDMMNSMMMGGVDVASQNAATGAQAQMGAANSLATQGSGINNLFTQGMGQLTNTYENAASAANAQQAGDWMGIASAAAGIPSLGGGGGGQPAGGNPFDFSTNSPYSAYPGSGSFLTPNQGPSPWTGTFQPMPSS